MAIVYRPLQDAIEILMESETPSRIEEQKIRMVLEDTASPVSTKYLEKLFDSVISKGHINFGSIPESKGDIEAYDGYANMKETLEALQELAKSEKNVKVGEYVATVMEAIAHLRSLAPIYKKGFQLRSEYVMLEYNVMVYTIVQAVSAIL